MASEKLNKDQNIKFRKYQVQKIFRIIDTRAMLFSTKNSNQKIQNCLEKHAFTHAQFAVRICLVKKAGANI